MNLPPADHLFTVHESPVSKEPAGGLPSDWVQPETAAEHAKLTPIPESELPTAEPLEEETIPNRILPDVLDAEALAEMNRPGSVAAKYRVVAILASQGLSSQEIAEQLGYKVNSIHLVLKRPEVHAFVLSLQERYGARVLHQRLGALGQKAIAVLDKALDAGLITKDPGKLQVSAAKEVLDKIFPTVNVNVSGDVDLQQLTDAELMQRARGVLN